MAILLLAGGGAAYYLAQQKEASEPTPAPQAEVEAEQSLEAVVEITDQGFEPETLQVKKGTKVTWVNRSNNPYRVASNPHPEMTGLPDLDSKDPVGPDQEYSFTFTEAGTFGYHNYYDPLTNGEVVVQE